MHNTFGERGMRCDTVCVTANFSNLYQNNRRFCPPHKYLLQIVEQNYSTHFIALEGNYGNANTDTNVLSGGLQDERAYADSGLSLPTTTRNHNFWTSAYELEYVDTLPAATWLNPRDTKEAGVGMNRWKLHKIGFAVFWITHTTEWHYKEFSNWCVDLPLCCRCWYAWQIIDIELKNLLTHSESNVITPEKADRIKQIFMDHCADFNTCIAEAPTIENSADIWILYIIYKIYNIYYTNIICKDVS